MKQKQTTSIISGSLFAILLIYDFINLILALSNNPSFPALSILNNAGYAVIAYSLFTSRRDIVLLAGFGISALANLLNGNILSILTWLAVMVICITYLTDYLPQLTKISKSIWFVPAACVVLNRIIWLIRNISILGGSTIAIFLIINIIFALALLTSMNYIVNPPIKRKIEVSDENIEQIENIESTESILATDFDTIEELKKFKDLLDCDAISQEEFDAKKKQLLGQ